MEYLMVEIGTYKPFAHDVEKVLVHAHADTGETASFSFPSAIEAVAALPNREELLKALLIQPGLRGRFNVLAGSRPQDASIPDVNVMIEGHEELLASVSSIEAVLIRQHFTKQETRDIKNLGFDIDLTGGGVTDTVSLNCEVAIPDEQGNTPDASGSVFCLQLVFQFWNRTCMMVLSKRTSEGLDPNSITRGPVSGNCLTGTFQSLLTTPEGRDLLQPFLVHAQPILDLSAALGALEFVFGRTLRTKEAPHVS